MKNILEFIRNEIAQICQLPNNITFICEYPRDISHGDFATNIAMTASKYFRRSPMELAENFASLRKKLNEEKFGGLGIDGIGQHVQRYA